VLLGAAIGFSIGYVYPWLLHYRFGAAPAADASPRGGTLSVLPLPNGLSVNGSF
jgi:hypothetical protein